MKGKMKRILPVLLALCLLTASALCETDTRFVTFGSYYTAPGSETKQPIEWIVLEEDETGMLLISCDILDCVVFHDRLENTSWEKCTLRRWLNGTFADAAFSEEERALLLPCAISPDPNPRAPGVNQGAEVTDQVFLLSYAQAVSLIADTPAAQAVFTPWAARYGTSPADECGFWWLRTLAFDGTTVTGISPEGYAASIAGLVTSTEVGVRPCIKVRIG